MIAHRATLDVPVRTVHKLAAWLAAYRRRIGTRKGRRVLGCHRQAVMVLRWSPRRHHRPVAGPRRRDRDLHRLPVPARGHRRPRRAGPGPARGSGRGPPGRLVARQPGRHPDRDRPGPRPQSERQRPWYSGKHKHHGGNVQVLTEPGGFPVWTSPVEPGSTHDITAARAHVLPALYPAAAAGLSTLTDKGYTGASIGIQVPVKGRNLATDTATRNQLINALRAPGERGNAILKTRWTALQRIRLCPWRIGAITAAALVLSTLERGRY